jgi:hypothetical protein
MQIFDRWELLLGRLTLLILGYVLLGCNSCGHGSIVREYIVCVCVCLDG